VTGRYVELNERSMGCCPFGWLMRRGETGTHCCESIARTATISVVGTAIPGAVVVPCLISSATTTAWMRVPSGCVSSLDKRSKKEVR